VTPTFWVPMISAGLLGSFHCIGMCGGLIAVASDGATGLKQRVAVQAGYQAARLTSYATLGAIAGGVGHALDFAGRAAGFGTAAAVLAGLTMTWWGSWAMLEASGVLKRRLPSLRLLPAGAVSWLTRARKRPPLLRAVLLGSASALLPCGFLYAFALAAAGTGSPLGGALVMGALWLGNLPALLGFGLLFAGALTGLRRHIPLLSAFAVLSLGVLTLNSRINLPALAVGSVTYPRPAKASPPSVADCPYHKQKAAP
jgi:uncharacterized protein